MASKKVKYAICISEDFESAWIKDFTKTKELTPNEISDILESNIDGVIAIATDIENKINEKKNKNERDKLKDSFKIIK